MSDRVLFQMWEPHRQSLIAAHIFYVEHAQKRLLSQFDDISAEADKAADDWLERSSDRFDPDRHDPSEFYEGAHDAGIEFYGLLSDMRDQTRLSVVAGMFHEWDKQFRDWLVREIAHWHHGKAATQEISSVDFLKIAQLLECLGWKICSADYYHKLDECRLVVNVYKHGTGKSLDDLKQKYPDYLEDPFNGSGGWLSDLKNLDHTHLKVSDQQFQEFSDAITKFWQAVPKNIFESQISQLPDWFSKAIMKDQNVQQQAIKK